jgi:hypothetical protein
MEIEKTKRKKPPLEKELYGMLGDIVVLNKMVNVRGMLESLFLVDMSTKIQQIHIYRIGMAIFAEGGACCGGQVCTWCLHAIPSFKDTTVLGTLGKHYITGSKRRCSCAIKMNAVRVTREHFPGSQSQFFVNKNMMVKRNMIVEKIRQRNIKHVMALIHDFIQYMMKLYEPVKREDPERYKRILYHDAVMTMSGVACSLCRIRRIDLTRTTTTKVAQKEIVPYTCCYDCVYQLNLSSDALGSPSLKSLTEMMMEEERVK